MILVLFPRSCRKRRVDIGDQVLHILDANREADEAIADAKLRATLWRNRTVCHRDGMAEERLDAAERLGEGEDAHCGTEPAGAFERPEIG